MWFRCIIPSEKSKQEIVIQIQVPQMLVFLFVCLLVCFTKQTNKQNLSALRKLLNSL